MHRSRITHLKEIMKESIRNTPFRGQTEIVAASEENLNVFKNVMEHSDVKQMLQQKGVTINLVLSKCDDRTIN